MRVGIPKEIKNNEFRVSTTAAGVHALVLAGHTVFVEKSAGVGSAITDAEYEKAGATILATADEVTSATIASDLNPASAIFFVVAFNSDSFLSTMTTVIPITANLKAVAEPMPPPAPEIMTTESLVTKACSLMRSP